MKKIILVLSIIILILCVGILLRNKPSPLASANPYKPPALQQPSSHAKIVVDSLPARNTDLEIKSAQTKATNAVASRPQMDGSMEAQRYLERAYHCGAIWRGIADPRGSPEMKSGIEKQLGEAGCNGMDLSSESIFTDLLSQARAGNPRAVARFATGAPLADPDPLVQAKLEQRYAAELPIVLSRATALGDAQAMRLSAEYFSACRIRLNGVSIYSRSPGYTYNPQESLRLLQRARELSGPSENSLYSDFERLLLAGRAGSRGDICPTRGRA